LFPDERNDAAALFFDNQTRTVLNRGWPGGEPELSGWLDQMFGGSWSGDLARAARFPLGVVEDPRRRTRDSHDRTTALARTAGMLLMVRGLRQQARGDPAALVADLNAGLALSRNLRNHAEWSFVDAGRAIESTVLQGLDRWLEHLDGHPDLLRE